MLRLISLIAVLVTAVGVAVLSWSAWWLLLAIFIHSSFEVSSGPSFDRVMTANREGELSVFPRALLSSEELQSELQSQMRNSHAVFCLKNKITEQYSNLKHTHHTTLHLQ